MDKLPEWNVYRLIMEHLIAHHPLPDNQWGFLPGQAATTALLTTVDEWQGTLIVVRKCVLCFLTSEKLFTPFYIKHWLPSYLASVSTHTSSLGYVTSYLTSRTQKVLVNGSS